MSESETTVDTTVVSTPAPAATMSVAERIARAGTSEYPQPAPAKDNSVEKQTPVDGQPAEKSDEQKPEPEKVAEPPKEGEAKKESAEPEKKEEKVQAEKLDSNDERLLLGLEPEEPETVAVLKKRYSDSSRENTRIRNEISKQDEYLKSIGVKFVRTPEGKVVLSADEKYFDSLKDIPDIYSSLSEEERGLVDKDVAAKIVKTTMAKLAVAKPKAELEPAISVVDDEVIEGTFNSLSGLKTAAGDKIYPDLDKPEVAKAIGILYHDKDMAELRKWADTSKDRFRTAVKLLYAVHARKEMILQAKRQDLVSQREKKKQESEKKLATGARTGQGQTQPSGVATQSIAERIAKADLSLSR